eukprot:2862145-Alexandrium_andersonii.AAC.1
MRFRTGLGVMIRAHIEQRRDDGVRHGARHRDPREHAEQHRRDEGLDGPRLHDQREHVGQRVD